MSEQETNKLPDENIPEAAIAERKGISMVWFIPIIAVLIGAWLTYKAYTDTGPTVTITFKTATGLVAGKSKVKYKNVEVGQVEEINFKKDLSGVDLKVQMNPGIKEYLTNKTNFWIVRARIAAGQVSGLGTLFSGAYIGIDPVAEGEPTQRFVGLEVPPPITTDVPGKHFMLQSTRKGSIDVGTTIYYRQIKVGQVLNYKLDDTGKQIDIEIFVREPYDQYVYKDTRFWNASGLDISLNAEGITIDTESFASIIVGGIAFDTPTTLTKSGEAAEENHVFWVYKNLAATRRRVYTHKESFLLHFDGSVRGLVPGAPVEVRGIKVGEVIDVRLELDVDTIDIQIPVLIEIEPERVFVKGHDLEKSIKEINERDETQHRKLVMEALIAKGLRAGLKSGSLLTGKRYVALDFYPDAAPAKLLYGGAYPEIPTIPIGIAEITAKVTDLLEKLDRIPLEKIGNNIEVTTANLARVTETFDQMPLEEIGANIQKTVAALEETVEQANKTLLGSATLLRPDSPLQLDLRNTLQEIAEAARALRDMADYLERHPEALLRGKGK